jgi:hypothetical protein
MLKYLNWDINTILPIHFIEYFFTELADIYDTPEYNFDHYRKATYNIYNAMRSTLYPPNNLKLMNSTITIQ